MSSASNAQRREEYQTQLATLHTQLDRAVDIQSEQVQQIEHLQQGLQAAVTKDRQIEATQQQNGDNIRLLSANVAASDASTNANLKSLDAQRVKVRQAQDAVNDLGRTESTGHLALKCLNEMCERGSVVCKVACTLTVVSLVGAGGGVVTAYTQSEDLEMGGIAGGLAGFAVTSAGFLTYYYGKKCIAKSEACLKAIYRRLCSGNS